VQSVYYETWTENNWHPAMKYFYTYDENNYLINNLIQSYNTQAGNWYNSSQVNYTNNENGTIHYYISQTWDIQGNAWVNSQRATYAYNSSDKPLDILYESWITGVWQNAMKYLFSYDESNYLTNTMIKTWEPSSNSWKNYAQNIYTNNDDGTVHNYLYQLYDTESGTWINSNQGTYTYSASQQLLTSTIQVWMNGNWEYSMLQFNTYDGNDYLIHNLTMMWEQSLNSWQENSQINYNNNDDGTIHQYVSQLWNTQADAWINSLRATYTYNNTMGFPEDINLVFKEYPNPAKERVNIILNGNMEVKMKITDLQGRVCLSQIAEGDKTVVNIKDLPDGIYFIILEFNNKTQAKKFIKN
jgi:hypothetical protein